MPQAQFEAEDHDPHKIGGQDPLCPAGQILSQILILLKGEAQTVAGEEEENIYAKEAVSDKLVPYRNDGIGRRKDHIVVKKGDPQYPQSHEETPRFTEIHSTWAL